MLTVNDLKIHYKQCEMLSPESTHTKAPTFAEHGACGPGERACRDCMKFGKWHKDACGGLVYTACRGLLGLFGGRHSLDCTF
jgi:hypothetical protein